MNTENGTKGDLWPKQTKIFGLFLSPLPSRAEAILRPGLHGVLPLIVPCPLSNSPSRPPFSLPLSLDTNQFV